MIATFIRPALLGVLLTLGLLAAPSHAAPAIGAPAPAFTATDSKGATHNLADYLGKIVVLEWANPDCPYVRKHYDSGNMQKLQKDAADKGVVWLLVASSAPGEQGHLTAETAEALLAKENAQAAALLLDEEGVIGRAYDAKVTPHMYVIDTQGTLVYQGGIDDRPTSDVADIEGARNYVREALSALEKGAAVPESVTRAYGCNVKYKN